MDGAEGAARSSRLFVSGLPPYLDEQRLRAAFQERGEVTDVKIIRTRDGRSRQFGFVGFVDERQAEAAIAYFDNSYLDTARINVKFAEVMNSASLGRPWSKHSKGSSAHNKLVAKEQPPEAGKADKKAKKRKAQEPAEEDPELEEFLKVMQPRRAGAIWANDDAAAPAAKDGKQAKRQRKAEAAAAAAAAAEAASSDEEYEMHEPAAAAKAGKAGKPAKAAKAGGKAGKRKAARTPTPEADDSEGSDSKGEAGDGQEQSPALADAGLSDMDYLRSRVKAAAFAEEASEAEAEGEAEAKSESESAAAEAEAEADGEAGSDASEGPAHADEAAADAERRDSHAHAGTSDGEEPPAVAETGRLFLRNLPYGASEADLAALFEPFGELSEVHLVVDRGSRKSKGIALVQFLQPPDAEAALAALDGSIFQGRLLHILPAKRAPGSSGAAQPQEGEEGEKEGPRGFRQKREAERRADAGNRAAWNTLFMRPDTVAAAVAAHYGISKSQLLDKEAADLPVRLALGETHVIALTKAALGEAGVDVEALERAAAASGRAAAGAPGVERSPTALLVKNLPYSATEEDLLEVFERPGGVSRLVLPPTKTLALVEYGDAGTARRAFRSLAYKRFHDVPLYLEWAPAGVFRPDAPAHRPARAARPAAAADEGEAAAAAEPALDVEALRGDGDGEDVESCSIFVKGLAWGTGEAGLTRHFDAAASAAGGSLRAAKVAKRRGPDGKPLSAGYGFVEFSSQAVAKAVLRKLQHSLLDGHKLQLQLSTRRGIGGGEQAAAATEAAQEAAAADKDGTRTKLVVRNIAFEATPKELRALFQPFGQVRSVRLPRKLDRSHRGFAFVDFLSHAEAKGAMEAVAGTHLYGRRLVCEWAAQGEAGLDDLRAKTAAKFQRQAGEED